MLHRAQRLRGQGERRFDRSGGGKEARTRTKKRLITSCVCPYPLATEPACAAPGSNVSPSASSVLPSSSFSLRKGPAWPEPPRARRSARASRHVDLRWIAPRREDKQQRAAHSLEDFTARVLRGRQSRVRSVRVHQSCPLVGSIENPTGRDSSGRSGRGVMVRRRACHGIDEDGWPAKFLQHYRPALSRSASFSERSGSLGTEKERDRPIWL